MKIYKTQKEIEKDIKDEVLTINGDVKFDCSFNIEASIKVIAGDIKARDIKARDIEAGDIEAGDIEAWDIEAGDIEVGDIEAWDIKARDIEAGNIIYYAFCSILGSIKCLSIKARRDNHSEPKCLDGALTIKEEEKKHVEIKVEGKTVKISRESAKALGLIK